LSHVEDHPLIIFQHPPRQLEELDLIEKDEQTRGWHPVDSILAIWLRMQREEKISQ
jgi:hypothetical protein